MTEFAAKAARLPALRTILIWDAVFEFGAGIMLVAFAPTVSGWLAVGTAIGFATGAVFLAAAAALGVIVARDLSDRGLVRGLALANITGGSAGWLLLLAAWTSFAPQGRALLGVSADVFIALGVLELRSLRRRRR